jgi:hypothetical protein
MIRFRIMEMRSITQETAVDTEVFLVAMYTAGEMSAPTIRMSIGTTAV